MKEFIEMIQSLFHHCILDVCVMGKVRRQTTYLFIFSFVGLGGKYLDLMGRPVKFEVHALSGRGMAVFWKS